MAEEEPPPFRVVQSATGPGSLLRAPVVIACDHASARVPTELESLGLPAAELARHIAVDIGAGEVTLRLAKRLGCPAVLCNTSRLVVDCNRHPDEPAAIVAESDGTHIPGNQHLSAAERRRRIEDFHQPYHDAVRAEIDALVSSCWGWGWAEGSSSAQVQVTGLQCIPAGRHSLNPNPIITTIIITGPLAAVASLPPRTLPVCCCSTCIA